MTGRRSESLDARLAPRTMPAPRPAQRPLVVEEIDPLAVSLEAASIDLYSYKFRLPRIVMISWQLNH